MDPYTQRVFKVEEDRGAFATLLKAPEDVPKPLSGPAAQGMTGAFLRNSIL